MFGANNSEQLYHLFLFGGLGFLLGIYYDVFRVWRILFRSGKLTVALQDVAFSLSSTLGFFLLTLAVTGGILRWYLFLGVLLGFAAYRVTVGLLSVRIVRGLIRWLTWAGKWLRRLLSAVLRVLWMPFRRPTRAIAGFFKKIGRKIALFFKKVLKSTPSILYTIKGLTTHSPAVTAKGDSDTHEKQ